MSFLNLFLKRLNNAKGFKLRNKSQKEIPPFWHPFTSPLPDPWITEAHAENGCTPTPSAAAV